MKNLKKICNLCLRFLADCYCLPSHSLSPWFGIKDCDFRVLKHYLGWVCRFFGLAFCHRRQVSLA